MTPTLAAAYAAIDLHTADPTHRAKARGLMAGYDAMYAASDAAVYTVEGVEDTVTAPLVNLETGRSSRTFILAGKLDVRLRDGHGRSVLMDHKTTSEDISDADAMYWRQLIVESQPSHYMLLEWQNGRKVDACVWDVVRKPAIRQKQTETLDDYEARLADDCTTVRPDWYFRRREIPRLDSDLAEYAGEVWQHAEEIRLAVAGDRHPRSSGACIKFHTPCKYLGICSGYDAPDSGRWRPKPWVHSELPIMDGDGKQYLTNSRIRNFQACRRQHQFDYLLGIERVVDEDRESLVFGTLWHEAQAAWWGALMAPYVMKEANRAHSI